MIGTKRLITGKILSQTNVGLEGKTQLTMRVIYPVGLGEITVLVKDELLKKAGKSKIIYVVGILNKKKMYNVEKVAQACDCSWW